MEGSHEESLTFFVQIFLDWSSLAQAESPKILTALSLKQSMDCVGAMAKTNTGPNRSGMIVAYESKTMTESCLNYGLEF